MGVSYSGLDDDLRAGLFELLQAISNAGLQAHVTSTVRSQREQKLLFDRYQAGNAQFPAVPPLHSAHEYGWAFDLVVSPYDYQSAVGNAWRQQWGGDWGGSRDPVHFELPGAGKMAFEAGERRLVPTATNSPSLWDYAGWALDFTGLWSMLFELGYTVSSRQEAEKIARALHIDPNGRVF